MKVVCDELHLTADQVGWCIVGSVSITVLARVAIGLGLRSIRTSAGVYRASVDRFTPRDGHRTGPPLRDVSAVSRADRRNRAGFVITQFHTSVMFASNCVGTANATTAGWGNLGGGVTQAAMPLLFGLFVTGIGLSPAASWRLCMVVAGLLIAAMGIAYWFLTQDLPEGDYVESAPAREAGFRPIHEGAFAAACRDRRVGARPVSTERALGSS